MPRTKNLKKPLDITNHSVNNVNIDSNFIEENISSNAINSTEIAASTEKESNEYTIDPITGKKYLKPKGFSDVIQYQSSNIPQIVIPGFKICAPTTENEIEIQRMIDMGWEFVQPSEPGCEDAARLVYAGSRKDNSPFFHRLLKMPEEKWNELENRRQNELTQKEQDIIYNVAQGDPDMYVPKEFRAPVNTRNQGVRMDSSGMDNSMANAYKNAMR